LTKKIYLIILVLFSLSINQYYAYRGIFPIDSFLIFDSGYNVMSGHHPFKDYWLITGPVLDYIQSLFFHVFKVNWFSYALHASLLNMFLALFSYYFFLKLGLKSIFAFIYSLGIAILAYPSIGTPFVDHHAIIFSVMALYSLIIGIYYKKNLFWFLIPLFLILSFFSKQVPSTYISGLFAITIMYYFFMFKNKFKKQNFTSLLLGCFFSFLLISIIFFKNQIPIENFLIQYIYYPYSLGELRISELKLGFENFIAQFKFIYISIIPTFFIIFLLFKNKNKNLIIKEELLTSFVFIISILIFIYYQLLTLNQILIFFLIPICLGFSHSYTIKYFNKKYIVYFILIIFIFTTTKYHIRFNHNKKFMELTNVDFEKSVNASEFDQIFKGLKWITPTYADNPSEEIELLIDVKNILSKVKEEKIIISDYQFFSAILKNKSASPNKWYDKLSIPDKKNKYYIDHKNFFIKKIKENNIKKIYFIGENMHKIYFFEEFIYQNKCSVLNKLNILFMELDISKCEL